jgi:DNA polymerase-3 subunit epsilon
MALDFCAIDFETANSFRGSPCAVGLVRVLDGRVAESRRFLMRPPLGRDNFDDFNVMLHGITASMVRGEPRFGDLLPTIIAFAGGLPLVAHYAAFDMGVIRDGCDASGLAWPTTSYLCTLVLSRVTWSLLSYSLPWAAEAAGISLDAHHEPEADAAAAAGILLAIARLNDVDSLEDLLTKTKVRLGVLDEDAWEGCHRLYYQHPPSANENANPDHPLYGREIAFTGALLSMTRAQAWGLVAEAGGQPAAGVTKTTNILVEGYQDLRKLRPGEGLSAKARKAEALRAAGQEIELMHEEDFLQRLTV